MMTWQSTVQSAPAAQTKVQSVALHSRKQEPPAPQVMVHPDAAQSPVQSAPLAQVIDPPAPLMRPPQSPRQTTLQSAPSHSQVASMGHSHGLVLHS